MQPYQQLISHLGRGGYSYYWVKQGDSKLTRWFDASILIPEPKGTGEIYFGVNPSIRTKGEHERPLLADIAAVNCLFAEFDGKDYNHDKAQMFEHIRNLGIVPNVVIDSGGGYHCYWLLDQPTLINTTNDLDYLRDIQGRWVDAVGGDRGAKDICRVLRVPGTYNHKYDPPREVNFIVADFEAHFLLDDLIQALPPKVVDPLPEQPASSGSKPARYDDAGDYWLRQAVARAGEGNRHNTGFWLACQLRDAAVPQEQAMAIVEEYARQVSGKGKTPYNDRSAIQANVTGAYSKTARAPAHRPGNGNKTRATADTANNNDTAGRRAINDDAGQQKTQGLWPLEYLGTDKIKMNFDLQEVGDAELLAELYSGRVVYDHAEGAWYTWQGHYWQRDETGIVYRLIAYRVAPQYLHASADVAGRGNDELSKKFASRAAQLRNKKRIENVLYLAARTERLALTGNEWDSNPWLLGCANGVIDLRTGQHRPGQPGDYIRAHSEVNWQGIQAEAPRWEAFLTEVFGSDEIVSYMARLLGYGITGNTSEHILPILWGEGRNGKSTLLETLGDVLSADLATSSQADALMDAARGGGDGPKPFVFALRGKRLVWASESNEGRRLNAGLVKQLTGGDRLNVRTLHSKPVEFVPTHLLFLLTNHKPHISADDQAIWDRVHLVPFTMRFVETPRAGNERKRDAALRDRLRAELPGILAWLVRGCLQWQAVGLNPPEAIRSATDEYRSEEDTTGLFILERCVVSPLAHIRSSELYAAYSDWCKTGGISPASQTSFGKSMKRRFTARASNGIIFDGIGLAED